MKHIGRTYMTEKKLSRRDATKLLGAAIGGVALATLPPEWSKPELGIGTLPAHAQQSAISPNHTIQSVLFDGGDPGSEANLCFSFDSSATISPVTAGIPLRYTIISNVSIVTPSAVDVPPVPATLTGLLNTNASGQATIAGIQVDMSNVPEPDGVQVSVEWSFVNPSDGTGSSINELQGFGC
jgi:hypothetical protein